MLRVAEMTEGCTWLDYFIRFPRSPGLWSDICRKVHKILQDSSDGQSVQCVFEYPSMPCFQTFALCQISH